MSLKRSSVVVLALFGCAMAYLHIEQKSRQARWAATRHTLNRIFIDIDWQRLDVRSSFVGPHHGPALEHSAERVNLLWLYPLVRPSFR